MLPQTQNYQKLVPLGKTGFYINPEEITSNFQHWVEETPYEVKRKQLENFTKSSIIVLAGVLFVLMLTEK